MLTQEEELAFTTSSMVSQQLNNLELQGGKGNKKAIWLATRSHGEEPFFTLTESFAAAQNIKAALGVLGIVKDVNAVTVQLNEHFANSGWSVSTPLTQIDREKLNKFSPPKQQDVWVPRFRPR